MFTLLIATDNNIRPGLIHTGPQYAFSTVKRRNPLTAPTRNLDTDSQGKLRQRVSVPVLTGSFASTATEDGEIAKAKKEKTSAVKDETEKQPKKPKVEPTQSSNLLGLTLGVFGSLGAVATTRLKPDLLGGLTKPVEYLGIGSFLSALTLLLVELLLKSSGGSTNTDLTDVSGSYP